MPFDLEQDSDWILNFKEIPERHKHDISITSRISDSTVQPIWSIKIGTQLFK